MFGIGRTSKKLDEIKHILESQHQPARLIEKYAKLESALGINGLLDFYNAPPETFAMPPVSSDGRRYESDYFERKARNMPAFARAIKEFIESSTDEIIYMALSVRWLGHYKNFREKGLEKLFIAEGVVALHIGSPVLAAELLADSSNNTGAWQEHSKTANLVNRTIHTIRGSFDYGECGVFILAIPGHETGKYLRMNTSYTTLNCDIAIPPELIVDLVAGPTEAEKQLIDSVLRSYWSRLAALGYRAKAKYDFELQGQNPFADPIPDMLTISFQDFPAEIGLGTSWDARGTLEGRHRLSKINRIIAKHKA